MSKRIFTSESVTEGHPDKICDQISDGVLDAILAKDPQARVACECATTTGLVLVMGEITTNCYVDIAGLARDTITKIGYDNAEFGFDGMQGMIGVVGPTRMDYAKITARLSYFAENLGRMFAKPQQPALHEPELPEEPKE